MVEVSIQVQVAELKGHLTAIERDINRSIDDHGKSIDRQEQRNDDLDERVKALEVKAAVTSSEVAGMSRLKWLLLTAIATQLVGAIAPFFQAPTTQPAETIRKR